MNKLYLGDCLEVMNKIEDHSIDMILCDLPYGTTACKWDTIIPLESLWKQYKRIIKPKGAVILTATQPFTTTLISSNMKMFKYCWVWNKQSGGAFVRVKYRPLQTHEDIIIFGEETITYNPQMTIAKPENIRPINKGSSGGNAIPIAGGKAKSSESYNPKKRYPKTIISISRYSKECNSINRIHPTQKPVALFEYLIKTYTNEGELVLDNCAGSGTTAIACINTNRNYILIEKDPEYYQIAKDRIAAHTKL